MAGNETLAKDLLDWHEGIAGEMLVRPGDPVSARQWLAAAVGDDAQTGALRGRAAGLADGVDWSRLDEHQTLDHLVAALTQGRLLAGTAARPQMLSLVPALAPAPPPPPPAAPALRAAPAAPARAVETTFGSDLDVAAMVAVLQQAAQDGLAFCEECARRAAEAVA